MAKKEKKQKPPELAHDDREINTRAIFRFAILFAMATAVILVAAWRFAGYLAETAKLSHDAPPPMAALLPSSPPDPRLEPHPRQTLQARLAEEQRDLTSYGWVDAKKGVVRIPIERAMDILAERGLPTRTMGNPAGPTVNVPNDSSLTPPRAAPR